MSRGFSGRRLIAMDRIGYQPPENQAFFARQVARRAIRRAFLPMKTHISCPP
jgi:hypothetical protein